MADSSAQADIRGLDIDKLVKGFADEEIIMKRYVNVTKTSAREIRWYQKTAGFLDSVDSTGITASRIANHAPKARPTVVEPTWTRNTSYVRKYMVESPLLMSEDVADTDVDILGTTLRDLVRAVSYQVDLRIWDIITESQSASNINSVSITNEWDDYSNATPIIDLLNAKRLIRNQSYDPEGAILMLNPNEHTYLINWLINTKGSSIPQFASRKIVDGVVMEILGLQVVVSTIVTADYAAVFVPKRAATWKTFKPISSRAIEDPGLGVKVRVWEEGECILHDPKCVTLLSNVGPS